MVDAGEQRPEEFAVVDDTADRDAAEADPVVAALTADQAGARAVATHVVIGERDLQCAVGGLGAGIAEEHVVEVARRQRGEAVGKLERLRVGKLEGRRIVELGGLALDRLHDPVPVVAGIAAPQARHAVEHGTAVGGKVVHILGARDQPRRLLECAIRRERQPQRLEVVGHRRRDLTGIGKRHEGSPGDQTAPGEWRLRSTTL